MKNNPINSIEIMFNNIFDEKVSKITLQQLYNFPTNNAYTELFSS